MDKNRMVIWTNDNFTEWQKSMMESKEPYETEYDFDWERYNEDCADWLDCEMSNLNIPVDGCIVAFADLGLWDGRHNGGKVIGDNVRDILRIGGDYLTVYCDRYNARCEQIHHDGTNYILFRLAKSHEEARRLVNKIAYGGMTEEKFMKATKSIKQLISRVYGW